MMKIHTFFFACSVAFSSAAMASENDQSIEQKLNALKLEKMQVEAMIGRMVKSGRMNNSEANFARREIASVKEGDKEIIRQEALEKLNTFKSFATK